MKFLVNTRLSPVNARILIAYDTTFYAKIRFNFAHRLELTCLCPAHNLALHGEITKLFGKKIEIFARKTHAASLRFQVTMRLKPCIRLS